jgi:hypothetical protein
MLLILASGFDGPLRQGSADPMTQLRPSMPV